MMFEFGKQPSCKGGRSWQECKQKKTKNKKTPVPAHSSEKLKIVSVTNEKIRYISVTSEKIRYVFTVGNITAIYVKYALNSLLSIT